MVFINDTALFTGIFLVSFYLLEEVYHSSAHKKEDRLVSWVNVGMREGTVMGSNKFRS